MTTYHDRMEEYRCYAEQLALRDNTDDLQKALEEIRKSQRLIIGGGAGLSACGGLSYMSSEILARDFPQLKRLGYRTLWEALWDDKRTKGQAVGMMAAEILWACYDFPVIQSYRDLLKIVEDKDYYVLTSNIDGQFKKAGFSPERIFEPQCSAKDFQCSVPCCSEIWDGGEMLRRITAHMNQETYECPKEYYPVCPRCHAPAIQNMRGYHNFIEDRVMWNREDFERYVKEAERYRTVFLELGAGFNSPGIIRHPFQRLAYRYPDAVLIRMNQEFPGVPEKIKNKSVEIGGDIGAALSKMRRMLEEGDRVK